MNKSLKQLEKIEKRIKLLSPPKPSDFVGGEKSAAYKTALANWKNPANYPKGGPLPLFRSEGYKPNIQNELNKAVKEQQRLIKHIQTPEVRQGQGAKRMVRNKDYIPNFRTNEYSDRSFGEGLKININKITQPSPWTNPKNSILEGMESNKNRLQLKTSETAGAFGSYLTIGKPPTSDTTTSSKKDGKPFDPNTIEQVPSKELQERFTQPKTKIRATDPKPPGRLYSDVHTIDPNTKKPLGVMTRGQRRKWEDNNQQVLQEALKNKKKPRDYYNRGQLTLSAYG